MDDAHGLGGRGLDLFIDGPRKTVWHIGGLKLEIESNRIESAAAPSNSGRHPAFSTNVHTASASSSAAKPAFLQNHSM
ncbi:MAG: hypothetical protein WAQ08_09070 [Aquabacterium sp.]|uniref:hypothetical protein n=1 Tax=Aquabacterium sp. TaxID=1872578 RepID=UPI003BAF23FA